MNPVTGWLLSYQNRSPIFRLANCVAMIQENVGPIGLPGSGVSVNQLSTLINAKLLNLAYINKAVTCYVDHLKQMQQIMYKNNLCVSGVHQQLGKCLRFTAVFFSTKVNSRINWYFGRIWYISIAIKHYKNRKPSNTLTPFTILALL